MTPLLEPEAGPTWGERAALDPLAAVLDPADSGGGRNRLIDRAQKRALGRALGSVAGQDVLDLGCGVGRLTGWLADRGARAVGVDPSPEMVEAAKLRVPTARFLVAGAEQLPFDDASHDVVMSVGVLQYLAGSPDQLRRALAEAARVLRPSGRVAAIEQVHDGGLPRGASVEDYEDALRSAGLEVRSGSVVRAAPSVILGECGRRPFLARLPGLPALLEREGRRAARTPLTGGRYADYLMVATKPHG